MHVWLVRSPDFENEKYVVWVWSGQGPASSLNCSAILVLEFRSTGNESPVALPWVGGDGGASTSGLSSFLVFPHKPVDRCM